MEERRKQPRKALMAYTQVFDLYGGRLLGYLGDLNVSGAMVIGDRELPEDVKITLAVELPELENTKATRITLPSRVAWCHEDISPEFFNIGFQFLEVKPEQEEIIRAIMNKYEFQRKVTNYQIKPPTNPRGSS